VVLLFALFVLAVPLVGAECGRADALLSPFFGPKFNRADGRYFDGHRVAFSNTRCPAVRDGG
jgi:hypothetical protein